MPITNYQSLITNHCQLNSSFPFKGKVGMGMGAIATGNPAFAGHAVTIPVFTILTALPTVTALRPLSCTLYGRTSQLNASKQSLPARGQELCDRVVTQSGS